MHPSEVRRILTLCWPVFIAQLAVMLNGVADTIMTGRFSPVHLAGVGIGTGIYVNVFVTLMGVLQGLSPVLAHDYGAGRTKSVGLHMRQGAWLALWFALPGCLLLMFPDFLLALAKVPDEVRPIAHDYLRAMAAGLPAILLARVFFSASPAIGRPRAVMAINLCALAIKVPLSWCLLHGALGLPQLGGAGCAVASSIVYWLVLAASLALLRFDPYYRPFGVFERPAGPDRKALGAILRLGIPIGLSLLVEVTSYTFMALLLARLGPTVSAAHQIMSNLGGILYMLPLSIGIAAQILIAQSMGRGDPEAARRVTRSAALVVIALALCTSTLLILLRVPIARLYNRDAAVEALALTLFPLLALYHPWDALQAVVMQSLRGYHRAVVPMLIYAGTLWGIGLVGGYVAGLEGIAIPALGIRLAPLGAAGFWLFAGIALAAATMALIWYLRRVMHAASGGGAAVSPGSPAGGQGR